MRCSNLFVNGQGGPEAGEEYEAIKLQHKTKNIKPHPRDDAVRKSLFAICRWIFPICPWQNECVSKDQAKKLYFLSIKRVRK